MAEMLAATLALPKTPLVLVGLTVELAPPARRFSLRGRDVDMLARAAGLALPMRIGDFKDGVAKLGPDEWLAILNPPALGEVAVRRAEPAPAKAGGGGLSSGVTPSVSLREPSPPEGGDFGGISIVDVSSRSIGISITGPDAAELIGAGCPLDLARMGPGRATRTLFETVEIILIRTGDTGFYIDVWRSFAPWLFAALTAAALA